MQVKYLYIVMAMMASGSLRSAAPSLPALVSHALTLFTAKKLTIRDYCVAKYELNAAAYAARRMLQLGGKGATHFAALEAASLSRADLWREKSNPLWSIDLYNPWHLVALVGATYTICRFIESYIVRPVYQKIMHKLKGNGHASP